VQSRRERVVAVSDGRIGYLHLHAMGPNDLADFAREFYANFDRDGLIIDVRRNRGGNIDSWVIEKLLRRAWMFWHRPGEAPFWNMQQTFRGHLAVLVDELTYSDGETFAAGVKSLGLGPLIGQRTAGAGVWLSDTNRLADRGVMRAAQWPQFAPDGRWLVEGQGVAPDIEVVNPPHVSWSGQDAQLDRAIEEVRRRLAEQPLGLPEAEAIPPRGQNAHDLSG
jgi:tricorn protease